MTKEAVIFTFYSYKGGVGRSMALANIARVLAMRKLRVVVIDGDLEAPGLENFFLRDAPKTGAVLDHLGLVDLLSEYMRDFENPPDGRLSVEAYLYPIEDYPGLQLMPAGRRGGGSLTEYVRQVQTLDFIDLLANKQGERFFDWFRMSLGEIADVVLIDSRTGVTEMGGICTRELADVVVALIAPTGWSLHGVRTMAESFVRPSLLRTRRGRNLDVICLPTRIDRAQMIGDPNQPRQVESPEDFLSRFDQFFDSFLPPIFRAFDTKFRALEIPYESRYAHGENLVLGGKIRDSYERLAAHMAVLSPNDSELHKEAGKDGFAVHLPLRQPFVLVVPTGEDAIGAADQLVDLLRASGVNSGNEGHLSASDVVIERTASIGQATELPPELDSLLKAARRVILVGEAGADGAAVAALERRVAELGGHIARPPKDLLPRGTDHEFVQRMRTLPHWRRRVRYEVPAPPKSRPVVDREDVRTRLLDSLMRAAEAGESSHERLLCVHGAAGSGKTELAAQACRGDKAKALFPDGILWIDLSKPVDASEKKRAICEALNPVDQPLPKADASDSDFWNWHWGHTLRHRKILMVLDGVDQAGQAEPYLESGNHCVRLVVSRTRNVGFGLRAAHMLRVPRFSPPNAVSVFLAEDPFSAEAFNHSQIYFGWPALLLAAREALVAHRRAGNESAGFDQLAKDIEKLGLKALIDDKAPRGEAARELAKALEANKAAVELHWALLAELAHLLPEPALRRSANAGHVKEAKELQKLLGLEEERFEARFAQFLYDALDAGWLQRTAETESERAEAPVESDQIAFPALLQRFVIDDTAERGFELAAKAERLFDEQLAGPDHQREARTLLLRMMRFARGTSDPTREDQVIAIERTFAESTPVRAEVALRLEQVGALRTVERDGQAFLEVACEKLPAAWGRWRRWVNEDRPFLVWRQELHAQMEEWQRAGNLPLADHAELVVRHGGRNDDLDPDEIEFTQWVLRKQAALSWAKRAIGAREAHRLQGQSVVWDGLDAAAGNLPLLMQGELDDEVRSFVCDGRTELDFRAWRESLREAMDRSVLSGRLERGVWMKEIDQWRQFSAESPLTPDEIDYLARIDGHEPTFRWVDDAHTTCARGVDAVAEWPGLDRVGEGAFYAQAKLQLEPEPRNMLESAWQRKLDVAREEEARREAERLRLEQERQRAAEADEQRAREVAARAEHERQQFAQQQAAEAERQRLLEAERERQKAEERQRQQQAQETAARAQEAAARASKRKTVLAVVLLVVVVVAAIQSGLIPALK